MRWLKNFHVFFYSKFMPHFTNPLYSLRMPESYQQNQPSDRPTKENSTHRYNSFIAHARIHELKRRIWYFHPSTDG